MTPQEEIDIYLGTTTVGDKTLVDIYLNKPIQEPIPNNDNVTQVNDAQNSSLWSDIVKKNLPDFTNVNPGDIRPQIPDERLTNPSKEELEKEETTNDKKETSNVKSEKTYKKHFYVACAIAFVLALILIFKKKN
jgi:hypothetical protein